MGAQLHDTISNKTFTVKCKSVVNCSGIFSDQVRQKDDPEAPHRIIGARGTHLMFKNDMLPFNTGIIIPQTQDGRLLFVINYQGVLQVGTTDEKCEVTHNCEPSQEEIDFIIQEIKPYFPEGFDFKANLISAYAGIRPLVKKGADLEPKVSHDGPMTQRFKRSVTNLASKIQSK